MSHTVDDADDQQGRHGRSAVQKGAAVVGVVFLLVGVLGFIPGATTNYCELAFASHHSQAQLLLLPANSRTPAGRVPMSLAPAR